MALEKELETYNAKLPSLLGSEGKFALVSGDQLEIFTSYEDAIQEGYRRHGLTPFMVKRIQSVQQAQLITRLISPVSV